MSSENDITILIKTFLRKESLFKLLKSIKKFYPHIKIMIVDDGNKDIGKELKKFDLDIEYHKVLFDSGVSYGRNYALNLIKTKYFLLCDDDFIFTKETKIFKLKEILEKNNADIVGGVIRNQKYTLSIKKKIKNLIKFVLKKNKTHNYYGNILNTKHELIVEYYSESTFNKVLQTDICLNFFLGRTEKIKSAGGWNQDLKIGEHTDFFIRMKENKMKVMTTTLCVCNHYPIKQEIYKEYRERTEEMTKILFKSRNLSKQISIFPEQKIKNIYFFENGKLIKKVEQFL